MSNYSHREQELEDCLSVVAYVISHHGEDYWPVYKLFEEELERLRSRRSRLQKTLSHISPFESHPASIRSRDRKRSKKKAPFRMGEQFS